MRQLQEEENELTILQSLPTQTQRAHFPEGSLVQTTQGKSKDSMHTPFRKREQAPERGDPRTLIRAASSFFDIYIRR